MSGPSVPVIGIMGASLGTGNRGVSALGAALVKTAGEGLPDARPVMLIGERNADSFAVNVSGRRMVVPVVNYRMSPRASPSDHLLIIGLLASLYRLLPFRPLREAIKRRCPWIRTVAGAALVGDIRGGDSFSDIYGLRGFLLASLPVMTVIWVRGEIVLFPQTFGPYRHFLARAVARHILRHAPVILSRDRESMETVRSLIGPTDRLRFCPDVAFALDPTEPDPKGIEPPLPAPRSGCLVGINVNGLMYNGGYTRRNMFGLKLDYRTFLCRLTERLLEDESTRILLVPHTFAEPGDVESDPQACREVLATIPEALRGRVHLVTQWYDQHEIKGVIGKCDFFIGSRMHSCIAALSQGIPAVGVAYSKKFKGVFDSVGAADWVVDGRESDVTSAVQSILDALGRREEMRSLLAARLDIARQQLRDSFAHLLHPLGRS